jgi:hypothetical protein
MTKILTTFLLFAIVACGGTNSKNESANDNKKEIAGWKTFSGTNYSIQYPPHWELNQNGEMGTSFILFSPLDIDKDQFRENVNLLIQDLSGQNIGLERFVEISEGQIKTMVTNSKLFESKRIKNADPEFHKLVYSGDQGVFRLKFEQYCWVINQKAYILTLTCEENKFSDYNGNGESILNSFSFKK